MNKRKEKPAVLFVRVSKEIKEDINKIAQANGLKENTFLRLLLIKTIKDFDSQNKTLLE